VSLIDGNGEVREMPNAKAVLEIIHDTGEPSAVNAARLVREGAVGKGPGDRNLAGGLLHGYVRFGGGPSKKALPSRDLVGGLPDVTFRSVGARG
jgi:hypothetical protein